ncbi:hypothetical protein MHT86_08010 [Corynebacterium mastitidis]|uniref:Uncharacterized protein n=1 Tax=Corynebacterium mastitidis TaxID=161890 RepID=A0A2N0X903_9CORY|nr:hypothetical protein [Corynebacterium mastitidis]MCH6197437.1 hypothetical protein [Corynebacterium mastitidis]PKF69159.1 hypothetical protein CXB45_03165 [Corynebacterium mastitidis]
MDQDEKQRLLDACAAAQEEYTRGMERLRVARLEAFRAASMRAVKNREIAEAVELSESMVGKIIKGKR